MGRECSGMTDSMKQKAGEKAGHKIDQHTGSGSSNSQSSMGSGSMKQKGHLSQSSPSSCFC